MTCQTVTTQAELDSALTADGSDCIHIKSESGVWLRLSDNHGRTVEASDSATVEAFGSATVRAFGSATVEAFGSATVEASGSATVRASDSATVEASGSAGVHAHHRSRITASRHVAVHLHSAQAIASGGVIIDLTALDLDDPQTWCDHHGVDITDGRATLYKAVDNQFEAGHAWTATTYKPGTDVPCADWEPNNQCGGGLHFSPTPHQARCYNDDATRYVKVTVALADLRPINNGADIPKCKARRCRVEVEVDSFARELAIAEAEAVAS